MRREDWPERLSAVLEAAQGRALVWGEHDCALNIADVVLALTGRDPAAAVRGTYRDAKGSLRALRRQWGVSTLEAVMDKHYPRALPVTARRGDVAMVMEPAEVGGPLLPSLAVVDGAWLVCAVGVRLPRDRAIICWAVD